MKPIHARRLLALAKFLRTKVPRDRFDMKRWVGPDWDGRPDLSCGTSACALGWATTMPQFRKLGLRLQQTSSGYGYVPEEAAWKIFGLDYDGFNALFIRGACTPRGEAALIERYVARARKAPQP